MRSRFSVSLLLILSAAAAAIGITPFQTDTAKASGSVLVVNTAQDLTSCKPPGDGQLSLHCAIADADADDLGDTIEFSISRAASVISLGTALPAITSNGVTIDGYTGNPDGATPNTNKLANGDNASIGIEIDGTSLGANTDGFVVYGSNVTIRGLDMLGFRNAISLTAIFGGGGTTGDVVAGNFIGNIDNFIFAHNNTNGVAVGSFNSGARIGGTTPADANVISGNDNAAVQSIFSSGVTVEGNYLGTTPDGTAAAPNGDGVLVEGDSGIDQIGKQYAGNVISGNESYGILIQPPSNSLTTVTTGTMIQGNVIGSTADQSSALGNGSGGVEANLASNMTIGGTDSTHGNYIVGNSGPGIQLSQVSTSTIQSNFIGYTNGGNPMPNYGDGIDVTESSTHDLIGGPAEANTIANNYGYGVQLGNATTDPVHVDIDNNSMFSNSYGGIYFNGANAAACSVGLAYGENTNTNDLMPCPIILAATPGKVVGEACTGCTVDVYVAPNSYDGEGEELLGTVQAGQTCTTSIDCQNFSQWTLPAGNYTQALSQGSYIVATATSTSEPYAGSSNTSYAHQTSEFSRDVPVGETLIVNTTANSGAGCPSSTCSLRDAINTANNDGQGDEIDFKIPSGQCSPRCQIKPTSALPALTAPSTFINGYTQAGSTPNTAAPLGGGDNAKIQIALDGSLIPTKTMADGLVFDASFDSVEGLAVGNFKGSGFKLTGQQTGLGSNAEDIVAGDFSGTIDGTTAAPNYDGVSIPNHSLGDTVGGRAVMDDNLLAGNSQYGVLSSGYGLNTLRKNIVGLNAAGTGKLGNGFDGVMLLGTSYDTIGGIRLNEGNVLSGNFNDGLEGIDANEAAIVGNHIGLTGSNSPSTKVGNGFAGVFLYLGSNNLIGDLPFGVGGNVIAGNAADGVDLLADSGDLVAGNIIGFTQPNGGNGVMVGSSNYVTGLARSSKIEATILKAHRVRKSAQVGGEQPIVSGVSTNVIAGNGKQGVLIGQSSDDQIVHVAVTTNSISGSGGGNGIEFFGGGQCGLPANGVNDLISCPSISSANIGTVTGSACAGCLVELFEATNATNDNGYGEGAVFLRSATAAGNGNWTIPIRDLGVKAGTYVTATASQFVPSSYQIFGGYYLETSQFTYNKVVAAAGSSIRSVKVGSMPKGHVRPNWATLKVLFAHATKAWPHYHVRFRPLKR